MTDDLIAGAIKTLYTEFERLSKIHEEFTDTDVREAIHLTLSYFFVWGKEIDRLPISYRMFSVDADKELSKTVNQFLASVCATPELNEISVGKSRLALLQDSKILTPGGGRYYEFIGEVDEPLPANSLPKDLFEKGDYDE